MSRYLLVLLAGLVAPVASAGPMEVEAEAGPALVWNNWTYGNVVDASVSLGGHAWLDSERVRVGAKLIYYGGFWGSVASFNFGAKEGGTFGVEGGFVLGTMVGGTVAGTMHYAVQVGETTSIGPTLAVRYTDVGGLAFYGPEVKLTVTFGRRLSDELD